jgi:hypothetical protein
LSDQAAETPFTPPILGDGAFERCPIEIGPMDWHEN